MLYKYTLVGCSLSSTLESHGRRSAIIWEMPDTKAVVMEVVRSNAVLKDWIWYIREEELKVILRSLNNWKIIK